MHTRRILLATWAATLAATAAVAGPVPAETKWTYQGRLDDLNGPITGQVDLKFRLVGSFPAPPTLIFDGQSGNESAVTVTDGLFNVELDFGVLELADRQQYLQIEVRSPHDPTDTAAYTTLTPSTPIRAAPLALALRGLRTDLGEPNSPVWNVIGGYQENSVVGEGGIVAGGGNQVNPNSVTWDYGVVSGGLANSAGWFGTVSGGAGNTASEVSSSVGGGQSNDANGVFATIAGGGYNEASGYAATVPGGTSNSAGGYYSFAGGNRATVRDAAASGDTDGDEGTFIWSGDPSTTITSTGPGQFLIDAPGGVGIGTTAPAALLQVGQGDESRLLVGSAPHVELIRSLSESRFKLQIGGSNWGNARLLQIGRNDGGMHTAITGRAAIGMTGTMSELALAIMKTTGEAPVGITQEQVAGGRAMELTTTDTDDDQATRVVLRGGDDAADIEFYTGARGSETATVFIEGDNGNVGIGTTTPSEKLEVNGMVAADGISFSDGSSMTTAPTLLRLEYLDPGVISGFGGTWTEVVTFPGAETGDMAIVSAPFSLQGVSVANTYCATNTVVIEFVNADGSSVDLGGANWRIMVIKTP